MILCFSLLDTLLDREDPLHPHDPDRSTVAGHSISQTKTIIPQLELTTDSETTQTGSACVCSHGCRSRHDNYCYEVDGCLSATGTECADSGDYFNTCIDECGDGSVNYNDYYSTTCCPPVTDTNEGCGRFVDATAGLTRSPDAIERIIHVNPEADVEAKINRHIRKTLSDVLSQIVQGVFTEAFERTIDIDDDRLDRI